jgi:hypothetical protein
MKSLCRSALLPAVFLLASHSAALACAACYGKSDSNMARSLNASIFTLMGVVVAVLGGAASFFVFLAKRAATLNKTDLSANTSSQPKS